MSTDLSASALFNVNGMVAVITGGGSGIGLMMTKALAANGAKRIYIIGRREEVLRSAAASIDPSIVIPLTGDITSLDSLLAMAQTVEGKTGYINLLVANAGIMGPKPLKAGPSDAGAPSLSDYRAHALGTPMAEFTQTYAVNTTGVYYTCLAFLELLSAGNTQSAQPATTPTTSPPRSHVIATSSIAGFSRLPGASFAYNSSKAAVTHMMKMLATSLAPYDIRCNVLAPGVFASELTVGIVAGLDPMGSGRVDKSVVPAGRLGSEEDVAGTVLWMASRAGAYLNGTVVVVDGGRLGVLASTY